VLAHLGRRGAVPTGYPLHGCLGLLRCRPVGNGCTVGKPVALVHCCARVCGRHAPAIPGKKRTQSTVKGVATADRVLSVLTAFRRGDGALSLAELSARTGLVKSTVMRLAVSLERHGLMVRLPDSSYQLDSEVFRLGLIYQQSFRLENFVVPVLEELVARLSETASFYIRRGDQRLCLFRVESPHLLRLHIREGELLPMDSSATAQVLRIFGAQPLPAYAATMDLPIYTAGVTDPYTASLAMPVFGNDGALAGALTVSGPIARLSPKRASAIMRTVRAAGADLTKALGGNFDIEQSGRDAAIA
jgi:DNA-binding IclR family transcriptional regulator